MFHPLLGWPETACGLHMTRVFQIGIIGLCANQGSGKRSISISATGVFTLTVGVFFRSWTQIVLCWVKLKAGALGSTIIKGKPAQRNKAFHLLEDHLIVSPALASQFHHRDSVILNDSKSISLLSPSGIGCHEAKTSVLRNSLGIIKVPCSPFHRLLLLCWHKRAARHSTWENLHIVMASSAALTFGSVLWSHIFLPILPALPLSHPFPELASQNWMRSLGDKKGKIMDTMSGVGLESWSTEYNPTKYCICHF